MTQENCIIECPYCKAKFSRSTEREKTHPLLFCAYCGARLKNAILSQKGTHEIANASLLKEHIPKVEDISEQFGPYQILENIGKGGMGEVFLAYDTICGRRLAIKRIRNDLLSNEILQRRFLHEARITSQLTHPSIIPIYAIDSEKGLIYYSMPFIEGQTLKQLIKRAKEHDKNRLLPKDPHCSIPFLLRTFLQVCQAVAYAHSKNVLHRDIKPENIIVGKYGQVIILDWGLATLIGVENGEKELEDLAIPNDILNHKRLTRIGKVVGTIAYMAPERAFGAPATVQTDIYSLGVLLYQILTLHLPFRRKDLKTFKRNLKQEHFILPEIMAPYREVPQILSEISKKCLASDPKERYQSVDALIYSLENYIEGRSEWVVQKQLDIKNKLDWQFQENILLVEHTAITRATENYEWVNLMISCESFTGNTRIETRVKIGNKGQGIGFLLAIPETFNKLHLSEGYCVWLSAENESKITSRVLRASVCVLEAPEIILPKNEEVTIRIEKIDQHLYFFLNDALALSYVSHIPVVGTYIGILAKDADYEMYPIAVSVGSQNITVNCLCVPDAFLAAKDYERALSEYRRIGASFPGRAEGREALFRAGITLLEKAKHEKDLKLQEKYYDLASEEFEKLRNTPGGPLEYLGKALIYQTIKEYEEEAKCYELAIRRFTNHPLLSIIEEQILLRMHESSHQNRIAAYHFIFLAVRFFPHLAKILSVQTLFHNLKKYWEMPFFSLHHSHHDDDSLKNLMFCLVLGYWLNKPHALYEILQSLLERPIIPFSCVQDAVFSILDLNALDVAERSLERIFEVLSEQEQKKHQMSIFLMQRTIEVQNGSFENTLTWLQKRDLGPFSHEEERLIAFCLRSILKRKALSVGKEMLQFIMPITEHKSILRETIDSYCIELSLLQDNILQAENFFASYTKDRVLDEKSRLYFAWGCYLIVKGDLNAAVHHFSQVLDVAFPRTWLISAHVLSGKIKEGKDGWQEGWEVRAFIPEKQALYEQLAVFWLCAKDYEKHEKYLKFALKLP